jgi:glutamine amidotransferase
MIVIIDYGIGNLASVLNMFKKIGAKDVCVSSDNSIIEKADKLILPGVGSFDAGMNNLEKSELIPVLNKKVLIEKTLILGICLGMQLLTQKSEEGIKPGLGWIDGETLKFNFNNNNKLKIPHMGWNYVNVKKENTLIDINEKNRFYFVHSYYVKCKEEQSIGTTHYGHDFTCMVNKENIFGAQFHPEKSLRFGMKFLENFVKL